jgi:hypothetical protein
MDDNRIHSRRLMHEAAWIAACGDSDWTPMVLLQISTHGVTVASTGSMASGDLRPVRFTLPGDATPHYAVVRLLYRATDGVPAGFRYGARFTQIDARTTSHIVDYLSLPVSA